MIFEETNLMFRFVSIQHGKGHWNTNMLKSIGLVMCTYDGSISVLALIILRLAVI